VDTALTVASVEVAGGGSGCVSSLTMTELAVITAELLVVVSTCCSLPVASLNGLDEVSVNDGCCWPNMKPPDALTGEVGTAD